MTTLFAQPYNIHAQGFYFETLDEYETKAGQCFDSYGTPAEEFEIQFIDGKTIDGELFQAWGIHQGNFHAFLEAAQNLTDHEKIALIAMGESGYIIDKDTNTDEVDIYYCGNLEELALQFIQDGLYGPIPDSIAAYIDYDAIARDLGVDYTELNVANQRIIYRCP